MKKGSYKTGILSLAGAAFIAMIISACNNEQSTGANKDSAVTDTTTEAPAAKKKGKASVNRPVEDMKATKVEKDKNGVYTKVEVMPAYPGNEQAIADYIASKIEYPEQAIENNVEGTVHVQFVVDNEGAVSDVTTIGNKLGYGLEEEAISVVSKLSGWEPGKVKGRNVKTRMTIPITYKLES